MKTKREVLEVIAKEGHCIGINCDDCPYKSRGCDRMRKIGAMAILRQNRKKREFDPNKVLTCVTADKAKVGMRGYTANDLAVLKADFKNNDTCRLATEYALFYPIEEVEE